MRLKDKHDICVVDWFSTQFENKIPLNNIEICLGTMIRQFSIAKCKLLFYFYHAQIRMLDMNFTMNVLGYWKNIKWNIWI